MEIFLGTSIRAEYILDAQSKLFSSLVLIISSTVFLYRGFYIKRDNYPLRFMALVRLFVVSIVSLIFSNNMISIIYSWDLLGVTSYFLVIYYSSVSSLNAGLLTMFINRVGDLGIVLLLLTIVFSLGGGRFRGLEFERIRLPREIFLGLAAFTKRAQLPFSSWLPAAIAAPTPVSSLVHSSTLVTAGVYLSIRCFYLLEHTTFVYMLVGGLTCLFATFFRVFEKDLKKVVAFSTLRHLGVMIVFISWGRLDYVFIHLVVHAFSKASLFIRVGYSILLTGSQEFKANKGFSNSSEALSWYVIVSGFRLIGVVFLGGFYSKDFFIERVVNKGRRAACFFVLMFLVVSSTLYCIRLSAGFVGGGALKHT